MDTALLSESALLDQQNIACQVFATMAGIETVASDNPLDIVNPIASVLHYGGAEQFSILIECSPGLAYQFAGGLMSMDCPTSLDEDVADSMGELANMIGGNLKGLMDPATSISAPAVLTCSQLGEVLTRSIRRSRIFLAATSGTCVISLLAPRDSLAAQSAQT